MAARRTFLKGLGIAVGASAMRGSGWAFAHEPSERGEGKDREGSVTVFVNDFGPDPLVVCAILASDVTRLRQAVRRTKRSRLSLAERRASAEVRASGASRRFKAQLYRQLGELDHDVEDGFVIVEAHVRNTSRWAGREVELYAQVLPRLLRGANLSGFDEIFVYANSRRPGWRRLFTGPLRHQLVELTDGASRVETFPVLSRKHEGLQVAEFAAYALFQNHRGHGREAFEQIEGHVQAQLDLSDTL